HERVGAGVELREPLQVFRRLAFRILLVHAVEDRKANLHRVDQFRRMAHRRKPGDDEARAADAQPVAAIGAVEHWDGQAHAPPSGFRNSIFAAPYSRVSTMSKPSTSGCSFAPTSSTTSASPASHWPS